MCGIAGAISMGGAPIGQLERRLRHMAGLIAHRGPDGEGFWRDEEDRIGFAHRRLAIIDLTTDANQPMHGQGGLTIAFNGEIYNYRELKKALVGYPFKTASDTETILAAYARDGADCVDALRGMFSFALWDAPKKEALLARDPFGIKPLYYTVVDDVLYFASEAKALLPFLPRVDIDHLALSEYFTFQFPISDRTLFAGVRQLMPGHRIRIANGHIKIERYWDIEFAYDYAHDARWFEERLRETLLDSVDMHLRSDVPVSSYVSGGVDSSLVAALSQRFDARGALGFHGKFLEYPGYDESRFARAAAASCGIELQEVALTHRDFEDTIETVLYHLDFPTAGPGSFPQYHVSKLAARSVKVILGGQGGDEIFGGYARYLVGYIEHALKAEIERSEGSAPSQDLRLSQIADGLDQLSVYKPMMRKQFAAGMFEPLDQRFLRLIDRTGDFGAEVNAEVIDANHVRETYAQAFTPAGNARANALDQMTRFDFKYLLPALLQVEDRVSMAHGLESRVPFVDRDVVALAATAPMAIKYPQGQLKGWLRSAFDADLPPAVRARRDKLGFPTPFPEWMGAESAPWLHDVFSTQKALNRDIYDARAIIASAKNEPAFARKLWGLLCLELWQRQFLDKDWRFEG